MRGSVSNTNLSKTVTCVCVGSGDSPHSDPQCGAEEDQPTEVAERAGAVGAGDGDQAGGYRQWQCSAEGVGTEVFWHLVLVVHFLEYLVDFFEQVSFWAELICNQ